MRFLAVSKGTSTGEGIHILMFRFILSRVFLSTGLTVIMKGRIQIMIMPYQQSQ